MRIPALAAFVASTLAIGSAFAKLPPLADDAKAKAAEAANKTAWSDKVAAYQLCQRMDHVAAAYRAHALAAARPASSAEPTPQCADPGPYAPLQVTPAASKPLEASGAHSPPGTATGPPSNRSTSAEMTGPRK